MTRRSPRALARWVSAPAGLSLVATLLLLLLTPAPADAQYFGRNQVQWEDFGFHKIETAHFDIYYYPQDNETVRDASRMAERWYGRLSRQFHHQFQERKPLIFYNSSADFQQTPIGGGLIGQGTGGFTEPLKSRLVMPLTGSYAETDHILGHEMVHEFQYEIGRKYSDNPQVSALRRLPLWMVEGLAEYLSVGREHSLTAMWLRDSVVHEDLPGFRDLARDPRYFPYRYGHAFWAWVGGRWGDDTVRELFVLSLGSGIPKAFEQALGMKPEEAFEAWHESIREGYEPIVKARAGTLDSFRRVLSRETTDSRLNLAPTLSPDGQRLAFLSTRDLFTVDLFLADPETGEVTRKLVSAQGNPHLDALRFIDSAGTWSPDGRRLAFAVFARGDNRLVIVDAERREVVRRIDIPGVDALSNPAWSPDGRHIAFTGQTKGRTDLWSVEVESGRTHRLTDDPHADLHPAWSPDGKTLAFATDRGADSDFRRLTYSPLHIALLDVDSGQVRTLPLFQDALHINPVYAPDGRHLYFIADPDGIANVYRHDLESGEIFRITDVPTGVSGITDVSPALTVAAETGRLLFGVFQQGEYNVHGLDPDPEKARQVASRVTRAPERDAAVLPPVRPRQEPAVAELLRDPTLGLDPRGELTPEGYDPDLSLDFIGTSGVGAFSDSTFGFGLAGGVTALFSDILGRHQLGVSVQGGVSSGDFGGAIAAQGTYLNRANRLNWGASGAHVPFIDARRSVSRQVVEVDGQPVVADLFQELREEVVVDQAGLLGIYPLSVNRRLEARGTFSRLSFDRELETVVVVGNRVVDRFTENLGDFDSLDLFEGSLAYVGDTSFYGFVSPLRGTRYRLEAGTTTGSLSYQSALADYRHYAFLRPVTLAFRAMHFGRYGDDADSPRLTPLFLGRETLVRGYDLGSFNAEECTFTEDGTCPEFDRLLGSRVGVLNFEVRVPIFGTEDLGLVEVPYLPTELTAFVDAGVAWTEDESPELQFDKDTLERVPVVSAGLSLRMLLGGYVPIQFYGAVPFQRPQEDLVFGFLISPGW